MSDAVKILIDAEDQASAKIAKASRAIEQNVKHIKDVGGKAKASTEFIGQLAGTLGGSEIAGLASQMGGLTEKISQFSEVSKLGGAGALAFKAGVAGLVGVLSFQVGKSIGDAVFQTEEWTKALEKARQESARLTSELIDQQKYRRDIEKREIALLPAEDQAKAQAAMLDRMRSDLERYKTEHEAATKEVAKQAEALTLGNLSSDLLWKGSFNGAVDFAKDNVAAAWSQATGSADAAKNKIEETARFIESLRADIKQMERQTSETESSLKGSEEEKKRSEAARIFITSLERENQLMTLQGEELFNLKAEMAGLVGEEQKRAVELMKLADEERKAQEEKKRLQEEKTREGEKLVQGFVKRVELELSLNKTIELRRIALEKGEEAARAAALEVQGLTAETAKRIAAEEAALSKLEQEKKAKEQNRQSVTPNLQATEMRLLRFGGGNEQRQIAQATQASQKHLEFIAKLTAERAAREAREPRPAKVQDIRFREVL